MPANLWGFNMGVKGLEITRRGSLLGLVAGASALMLPSPAKADSTAQADALRSIDLVRHDGSKFKLESVQGKVVVAAIWGAFCSVCRAEVPQLMQLQQRMGEQELGVVLLSHPLFWQEDYAAAQRLGLAEHAATASMDEDFDKLAIAFGLQGTSLEVPQSLLYARAQPQGTLSPVAHKMGNVNWQSGEMLNRLRRDTLLASN